MAHIEIELQDVLDFINNSTEDELEKITDRVLEDDYIKDLKEEKEEKEELEDTIDDLEEENDYLQKEINKLEEKIDDNERFESNTLYDEMKLKLLKEVMKKYSLEELENKLGTEHELSIGFKK
mgnify:FL=1